MSRPQTQVGYIYESFGAFHIRYYVHSSGKRKQRSRKLCTKDELHQSKTDHSVLKIAEDFMLKINTANGVNDAQPHHHCPICGNRCKRNIEGKFVKQFPRTIRGTFAPIATVESNQ